MTFPKDKMSNNINNNDNDDERLVRLQKKWRGLKVKLGKIHAEMDVVGEQITALNGDKALHAHYEKKVKVRREQKEKRRNAVTKVDKTVGKKKDVKSTTTVVDFTCQATTITGEPCKASAGNKLVEPASATKWQGKKVDTCKACKKAVMTIVRAAKKTQKEGDNKIADAVVEKDSSSDPMHMDVDDEE